MPDRNTFIAEAIRGYMPHCVDRSPLDLPAAAARAKEMAEAAAGAAAPFLDRLGATTMAAAATPLPALPPTTRKPKPPRKSEK